MLSPGSKFRTSRGTLYKVASPLKAGGQAQTYRVENSRGEAFVLKEFPSEYRTSEGRLRTSHLVERNVGALSPVLFAPFEFVECEGIFGHIAPLAAGLDLPTRLGADPLSLLAALHAAAALAKGIAALEAADIAHGDLHDGNVFLEEGADGRCVLIDFDNYATPGLPPSPCIGQPLYMAPEIRRGGAPPDVITDRYSLAVLLHELILLRHVAEGLDGSPEAYEQAASHWLHDPARATRSGAPAGGYPARILNADLARLFRLGVSEDRDRRPSAAAWTEAISRALFHVSLCPACGFPNIIDSSKTSCPGCLQHYPALQLRLSHATVPLIGRTTVIGRTLLGGDASVSERHAIVHRLGSDYAIEDLSSNGSYRLTSSGWVRLPRIEPLPLLQAGDRLRFAAAEAFIEALS